MMLPLKIAIAIQQMLRGERIPQSQLKHKIIDVLVTEGLISRQLQGRTKSVLYVANGEALIGYVKNNFGINDLSKYIDGFQEEDLTRSQSIEIASDSKIRAIRTFKGFLVNSYAPIHAGLNGKPIIIEPTIGTFTFIYDFESFNLSPEVTIVGIENPENFRHIEKQQHYFKNIKPLFVSRYPQGKDLVRWMGGIENPYLHFGDFDFEGINIYLNEYKKHLGKRASFFVPDNVEDLLSVYGNSELYNKQFNRLSDVNAIEEERVKSLVALFHKDKKVLEQEILISRV